MFEFNVTRRIKRRKGSGEVIGEYYYIVVPKRLEKALGRKIRYLVLRHDNMTFRFKVTGVQGDYYLAPIDRDIYELLGRPKRIRCEVELE